MTLSQSLILLFLLLALAILASTYTLLLRTRSQLRALNAHRLAANSELQKRRMELMEIRNRARLLEQTVSGGTTAVEKIHGVISGTTFGLINLFARDTAFRLSAQRIRNSHDQTSRRVYRTVRTTNRALHILADSLIIGKAEKRIAAKRGRAKP